MHTLARFARYRAALNSYEKEPLPLPSSSKVKHKTKKIIEKGVNSSSINMSYSLAIPQDDALHNHPPIGEQQNPSPPPPHNGNNHDTHIQAEDDEEETRPLKDYSIPTGDNNRSSINLPTTIANSEIKTSYMHEVQRNIFKGRPEENPQIHLMNFQTISDSIQVNELDQDNIGLRLFLFSFGPRLEAWLESLNPESITSWIQLTNVFLTRYFPPRMTVDYHAKITDFRQMNRESLSNA